MWLIEPVNTANHSNFLFGQSQVLLYSKRADNWTLLCSALREKISVSIWCHDEIFGVCWKCFTHVKYLFLFSTTWMRSQRPGYSTLTPHTVMRGRTRHNSFWPSHIHTFSFNTHTFSFHIHTSSSYTPIFFSYTHIFFF